MPQPVMPEPKLKRRGTPHAPPEERRAQILTAALRCLQERGYAGFTMDELAKTAGLAKGSVYRFFDSKDAVFLALFDWFSGQFFTAIEIEAEHHDTLTAMEHAATATLRSMASEGVLRGPWLEFLAQRQLHDAFARIYRESREQLASMIEHGIERGELRAVPVRDAAAALVALIEGLFLQAIVDPAFDIEEVWPGVWNTIRNGLEQPEHSR